MKSVNCLSCDAEIEIKGKVEIGQLVTCEACEAEFEIIGLKPLQIDWLFIDFEDEDEEGEDTYEDDEVYENEDDSNW